jgi:hypothetical protein
MNNPAMTVKIKVNMLNFIVVAKEALIATPIDDQNMTGFSNSLSLLDDVMLINP